MPAGSGRLGFRFRRGDGTVGTPRAQRARALMFFDFWTQGPGGNTNYYRGGDVNPETRVFPVIGPKLAAKGFEVDYVTSYSQLMNIDLNQYAQIWDVGYASPYIGNPTVDPTNKLTAYLQNGGAMFIIGENSWFGARDDAIDIFVTSLGGGDIVRSFVDHNFVLTSTVYSEFRLANQTATTRFNRPGTLTRIGTATPIASGVGSEPCAVIWKTGSLSQATAGTVATVLDVNIFTASYLESDFIDNLILSINVK